MAANTEEIGLLLVHGIGEQKRLEHLRETANEIASYVESTADLVRLSVSDLSATAGTIVIDAEFLDSGKTRHVRLNCREVWWADLGASGGLGAQVAFWFWGLGQWAAEIHFKGRKLSNTSELMSLPHFAGDTPNQPPGRRHRALSRIDLFFAGVLALLTLVTWSLVKRVSSFVAGKIPDTSLIFLFLGDVKAYQQPGGPGRGSTADPNRPRRATIRRRMVTEMTRMAAQRYDRWYILAHSLGSALAFNGLQETELALPNYLEQTQWLDLPDWLKTTAPYLPPKAKASVTNMMPRRPPWLDDRDGISREAMFDRFSGIVTYGSPLDKFAALWPRMVCLNKQRAVFQDRCEWLNLYDPTDPVGASLDGFGSRKHSDGSKISLVPKNFGCRSSKIFLLSHIRYLNPRRQRKHPMAQALVDALLRDEQLAAAARKAANSRLRNAHRLALAIIQVVGLFALLTLGATGVLLFGKLVIFGKHVGFPTCVDGWQTIACAKTAGTVSLIVFVAANALVLLAGVLRFLVYDWRLEGK
jgi:hypothetical protein